MKKISRAIIGLLIICLCFTMLPVDALATEEMNTENVMVQEVDATEIKTDEQGSEPVETKETVEEVSTEAKDETIDEDPGKFRLNGEIPYGFSDAESKTRMMPGASNGYVHNSKFDDYVIEQGIDVSYHQGTIEWSKVKAAGIDFALIRAAYRGYETGKLCEDTKYVENLKGAIDAGIPVGVYIFSQAVTKAEAVAEADYLLDRIKGYDISLPVVIDFEYVSEGVGRLYDAQLTKAEATAVCMAFCDRVSSKGYTPMVYASKYFLEDKLDGDKIGAYYPIWLANYISQTKYAGEYEFWQYTSTGKVSGISGNVDLNFRYTLDDGSYGPKVAVSEKTTDTINLEWTKDTEAEGYVIERASGSGEFEVISTIEGTDSLTFKDTGLKEGDVYSYRIRAYKTAEDGTIEYRVYSRVLNVITAITTTVLKGQATAFDTIKLTWPKVTGASGYQIQRYDASTGEYTTIRTLTDGSTVSYLNGSRNASTTYKYRIRAYKTVGSLTAYSAYTNVVSIKTKGATSGKVKASNVIVRKGPGTSYKKLTTVKKNKTLTITGTTGSFYRISIKVSGKTKTGYISKKYVLLKPETAKLKGTASSFDKVKLTWDKVSGASGYQIQRYNSSKKKYETVKTVTSGSTISYTNGSLNAGTAYKYRIRAYKKSGSTKIYGSYSAVISVKTGAARLGEITANKTKLRKGASTSYKILKYVNKGTNVTVTGSRSGWYRVSSVINGKTTTAYVVKKYVKLL